VPDAKTATISSFLPDVVLIGSDGRNFARLAGKTLGQIFSHTALF
jgi:hypothetical protein